MENIDAIKILQVNGLGGAANNVSNHGNGNGSNGNGSLADDMVNSALRYRAQAPLLDGLMNELGINGSDINGLTAAIKNDLNGTPTAADGLTKIHPPVN
jgi:uncharacterized membrane protein YqiK